MAETAELAISKAIEMANNDDIMGLDDVKLQDDIYAQEARVSG